MSYCINPTCPQPKNPNNVKVCQSCGTSLQLNNRYRPLGILGKGGFGATFGAADLSLPGTPICVVKQLRPATDDPSVFKMAKQLFEREAETLGKVGVHPQVPKLLDYFEQNQQFYLVQEYVKGNNLYQEVRKNGPFSEAGIQQFLSELLPILQYIHSQKVIHRDIKPANLIRSHQDKKLVLIDFGAVKNQVNSMVASNTSAQTALTAFAVGTAGFAPPEQMAMRPVYASDIYAVGVTCVYLLTGKNPKDIGCHPETGEIAWENYAQISESLANVLKKMLEISVKHRYKSAQEVLDALAMPAYDEQMQQSMTTMISGFSPGGNTGISQGYSHTHQESSNSDISNMVGNTQGSINNTNINVSKATPVSRVQTSVKRSPSSSLKNRNRYSETPNVGYSLAQQAKKGQRRKTGSQTPTTIKPVQWRTKTLLTAYQKGKRDFNDQKLNNLNLSKADLPGISFYGSKLSQVNLEQAELSRADFGKANLHQINFKDANLSEAYFGYSDLTGADLRGANLYGANFKYANLAGANLCGADLSLAQVTQAQLETAKTNWRTVMPSGKRGFW